MDNCIQPCSRANSAKLQPALRSTTFKKTRRNQIGLDMTTTLLKVLFLKGKAMHALEIGVKQLQLN